MSFPAYPAYRESGVEWLGRIPSHWTAARMGTLFAERIEDGSDDLPVLSVSIHDGVSDRELGDEDLDRKVTRSEDRSKYRKVEPGDLVYNMMRAWQGGFGTVNVQGLVSPAYVVARPRGPVDTKLIEHVLRTPAAVEEMRRHSRGVTDFRLRLYWDEFKQLQVPVPPTEERRAILAMLDRECGKIDALVAEQERLIALLKEKRQAVISQAVTKGLDPNAPMKDSGVEWLGEVPAHWEVRKFLTGLREPPCYGVLVPDFDAAGVPMLRITDIENGYADRSTLTTITPALSAQYSRTIVQAGDIALSVVGTIGEALQIDADLAGVNLSRALARLQLNEGLSASFLCFAFQSLAFERFVDLICVGTAQRVLNMSALSAFRIAFPSADEQAAISAYLDRETRALGALMVEAERAIALLKERRAALISAAVTGKIDVRGLVTGAQEAA